MGVGLVVAMVKVATLLSHVRNNRIFSVKTIVTSVDLRDLDVNSVSDPSMFHYLHRY